MDSSVANKAVGMRRIWELDVWRGAAVVGMVVFHVFYILNFFSIVQNKMYDGGWLLLVRFVQISFLGIVGISMAIGKKSYRHSFYRGLKILGAGMLVSAITYILKPDLFIRFGILHLIGVSIIILAPIAHYKYAGLFGGIISLFIWEFINDRISAMPLLYILGFKNPHLSTFDHFAIFPWISVILFGIFIGNFMRELSFLKRSGGAHRPKTFFPFILLGRNSLLAYMIHIPAIIAILIILNVIRPENVFGG